MIADEPEESGPYASWLRKLSAERRASMLAAHAIGKTLRQIAADHGCSQVAIANIIDAERSASQHVV